MVDRARGEIAGRQMHPIANDNRFVEGEPWLGTVPINEFVMAWRYHAAHLGMTDC